MTKPKPTLTALDKEWEELYDKVSADELLAEADFESLCIGWCLAKGMTPETGYEFYQKQIQLGYF